jgi:hypothetical protein
VASELAHVRKEWRALRAKRLQLKAELEGRGMDKKEIKHHKDYRLLEKQQSHLSKVLKHIEKRLNRQSARMSAHKA